MNIYKYLPRYCGLIRKDVKLFNFFIDNKIDYIAAVRFQKYLSSHNPHIV